MIRYLGWLANSTLFALCCFLVADTANALIAAWLREPPAVHVAATPTASDGPRSWDDWQVIVTRNLFHSTELSDATPEPVIEETLEETKLPLKLWGTIASSDPDDAWASIEDLDARETQAVRVGDQIKSATIVAVERQRVVLLERGKRRSLTLEEEDVAQVSARNTRTSNRSRTPRTARSARSRNTESAARRSMAERVKKLADDRFEVDRDDVQAAMSNPASLYTQARILPNFDEQTGEMTGIQISAIKPGSVFEQVGIQEGEVITAIGGVPINDVTQSAEALATLAQTPEVAITVVDDAGNARPLTLAIPSP